MSDLPPIPCITAAPFLINGLHVDPALGLVTGPEGSACLEPRVLAVLQALTRRAGTLVTRSELLDGIWPGADIYDEALTQCVYQLRQQLTTVGGAEYRNLITTVRKRGYILNAEVRPVTPEVAAAVVLAPPVKSRKLVFVMIAVVLLLFGSWAIFRWLDGTEPALSAPQAFTIAVLPFVPLDEYIRDPVLELGMADTLIARLSGIQEIVVRPIASVRRYMEMDRDALQAGRELGADAIMEGSIQRVGEDLRVVARLLRVSDGAALWAGTFNDSATSIFAVQDAISERITIALTHELGQQVSPKPAQPGTSNTDAYELFLKGRYYLARLTRPEMLASLDYFHEAVSLDPDYAQAWLGLASVQVRLPLAGELPAHEFFPNAKSAAQRALEIDPGQAEGYAMLGWISFWHEWDWAASEAHFLRAIELDPNEPESHLGYAHLLSNTGRHEQALVEMRHARELSPFFLVAAAVEGDILVRAQQVEEAILRLEDARQQNENFWLVRKNLAEAYYAAGRYEDALVEARFARKASDGHSATIAVEISALVKLGRAEEAEAQRNAFKQQAEERDSAHYNVAVVLHAMGDTDAALAWLERAYQARDPMMTFLGVGQWDQLRDRPEFTDLMRRMNLAELMRE